VALAGVFVFQLR